MRDDRWPILSEIFYCKLTSSIQTIYSKIVNKTKNGHIDDRHRCYRISAQKYLKWTKSSWARSSSTDASHPILLLPFTSFACSYSVLFSYLNSKWYRNRIYTFFLLFFNYFKFISRIQTPIKCSHISHFAIIEFLVLFIATCSLSFMEISFSASCNCFYFIECSRISIDIMQ